MKKWNKIDVINGTSSSRCKFRLLDYEADLNDVYEILSDEDVITNLNMNINKSIVDTQKLFEDYKSGFENCNKLPIAILEKETLEFIGVFLIKLDLYNEDAYEFTVYLKKKFWNQGYYSEILPYMTRFAFSIIGMGNFRGYVMEKNIASSKVLERSGFLLEKIFNVPGIREKIKSYLITKKEFERNEKIFE